jgi:hypothetical protein
MATITVRNLPQEVQRKLKQRAAGSMLTYLHGVALDAATSVPADLDTIARPPRASGAPHGRSRLLSPSCGEVSLCGQFQVRQI